MKITRINGRDENKELCVPCHRVHLEMPNGDVFQITVDNTNEIRIHGKWGRLMVYPCVSNEIVVKGDDS